PGTPAAPLQAVEERVEGGDVEDHHPVAPPLDLPADVVAVARTRLQQGEDEQLRAALLELAVQDSCLRHIWAGYTWRAVRQGPGCALRHTPSIQAIGRAGRGGRTRSREGGTSR